MRDLSVLVKAVFAGASELSCAVNQIIGKVSKNRLANLKYLSCVMARSHVSVWAETFSAVVYYTWIFKQNIHPSGILSTQRQEKAG